ncbi:unnamed protein product, partial [Protopolystoma xenopodis]
LTCPPLTTNPPQPFERVLLRREANQIVSVASTQWQQQRSVERRKGKQHLRRHGIAQEEDKSREDISGPDQFSDLLMTQQQQISDVNADFNSWLESYSIAYESSAYASSGEHASSLREGVDPARSPLSLLEASGTVPADTPKGDDETGRSAQPDTASGGTKAGEFGRRYSSTRREEAVHPLGF